MLNIHDYCIQLTKNASGNMNMTDSIEQHFASTQDMAMFLGHEKQFCFKICYMSVKLSQTQMRNKMAVSS